MQEPKHIRAWVQGHPNLIFWSCLLILNGLLFLPQYLLNRESSSFLPFSNSWSGLTTEQFRAVFLWRTNPDIFRLNAELILLTTLWLYVGTLTSATYRRLFRWFVLVFYFFTLIYYVYESISLTLYQMDPVFYDQAQLFADGLEIVFRNLQVPPAIFIAAGLAVLVFIFIIERLTNTLFNQIPVSSLSKVSKLFLILLALVVSMLAVYYQDGLASPKMVVSSLTFKLRQNISESFGTYQYVASYDESAPQRAYDFRGQRLINKPNVYLIFVESYGSILYKRPDYREAYERLLAELQEQMAKDQWYTVSALSESPVWGGGSWMAYTSALFGLRIDSHPHYLALRERYQDEIYPDLGYFFKTQGYHYARLSSLSVQLKEEDLFQHTKFFKADQWLKYADLEYLGPGYGWGKAPPDQYALNAAQEMIDSQSDQPLFLFFLTQNSHYPWVPLPRFSKDWRALNQEGEAPEVPESELLVHKNRRANYMKSIDYELRFLTDFILNHSDDDSIFILIGDHQPQQVSRRDDGWDTPVHIISKDREFLNSFGEYGFTDGLIVEDITPKMRHEGLYSLLVRTLLAHYGQGTRLLPPYLPNGVEPVEVSDS